MKPSEMAAALGRLGGRARAMRLSAARRRDIASAGGTARSNSLSAARRIERNFEYVAVLDELRRERPVRVKRERTSAGPLPGIYVTRT